MKILSLMPLSAVALACALSACGGGDDSPDSGAPGGQPSINDPGSGSGSGSGGGDSSGNGGSSSGSGGGQTAYTVTPSISGIGGTISPAQAVSVASGATTTLTIKPNSGYNVASVDGTCGGTLSGNDFTTKPVTADCTVVVTFAIIGSGSGSGSVDNGSYWTMDGYTYLNDGAVGRIGASTLLDPTNPADGRLQTVAMLTTGETDTSKSGPYPGGGLVIHFIGSGPGVYNIVPDTAALVAADPATAPMTVMSDIGTLSAERCAFGYNAVSGKVQVTRTTDGVYHFTSVGSLPTTKSVDALAGPNCALVPAATMSLTIHDATATLQ